MTEFCEGINSWTKCLECPLHKTQHPCWPAKVIYWQQDGKLRISEKATPNRRANRDKADSPPRTPNGSYDQAIVKDERGVPYVGTNGAPMTQKQINNMGSDFKERIREQRNGHHDTDLSRKLNKTI
jgi:hypothetical protein